MSKNSAKQMYTQLTEWLTTIKRPKTIPAQRNSSQFSKADTYNRRRN